MSERRASESVYISILGALLAISLVIAGEPHNAIAPPTRTSHLSHTVCSYAYHASLRQIHPTNMSLPCGGKQTHTPINMSLLSGGRRIHIPTNMSLPCGGSSHTLCHR